MSDDLIAELREAERGGAYNSIEHGCVDCALSGGLAGRAADAIDALKAENERLRAQIAHAANNPHEIQAAQERLARGDV